MKHIDLEYNHNLEISCIAFRSYSRIEIRKQDLPTVRTLLRRHILLESGDSIGLPEFDDEIMTITKVHLNFNKNGYVYRIIIVAKFEVLIILDQLVILFKITQND